MRLCAFLIAGLASAALSAAPGDAVRALPPDPGAAVVLRAADQWASGLARAGDLDRILARSGALRLLCALSGEGGAGEARILDAIAAAGEIAGELAGDVALAATDGGSIAAIEVRAGEEAAVLDRLRKAAIVPAGAVACLRPGLLIVAADERQAEAAGARIDRGDPPGGALAAALAGSADTAVVALAPGLPSLEVPIRAGRPGRPLIAAPIDADPRPSQESTATGRAVLRVPDLCGAWDRLRASCAWAFVRRPDGARAAADLVGLLAGDGRSPLAPGWDPEAAEACMDVLVHEIFPGEAAAVTAGDGIVLDLALSPAARVILETARRFGIFEAFAKHPGEARIVLRGDRLRIFAGDLGRGSAAQDASTIAGPAAGWPEDILAFEIAGDVRRVRVLDGGAIRIARGDAEEGPLEGPPPDLTEGELAEIRLDGPPADALRLLLSSLAAPWPGAGDPLPSLDRLAALRGHIDGARISILDPPPRRFLSIPDIVALMRTDDPDATAAAIESLSGESGRVIRLRGGDPPVTDRTHRGILVWRVAGLSPDVESFWQPVSAHLDGALLVATSPDAACRAIDAWLDGTRPRDEFARPVRAAFVLHADRWKAWALSSPAVSWALANRFGLERRDAIERAIRTIRLPFIAHLSASERSSAWILAPTAGLPVQRPRTDRTAAEPFPSCDPSRTEPCAVLGERDGRLRRAVIASTPGMGHKRVQIRSDGEEAPSWSARIEPDEGEGVRIRVERADADPSLDLLWSARTAASALAGRSGARWDVILQAGGATRILRAEEGPLEAIPWAGASARARRISIDHPDLGRATLWMDGRRRVLAARAPGWEATLETAWPERMESESR
ncbi:MAG: hypothetical protein JXP34_18105 [Planctomycetes bacterium]|nr:hypothetical protein [Planctomycetota bacterium]